MVGALLPGMNLMVYGIYHGLIVTAQAMDVDAGWKIRHRLQKH
jgi:hypothetical protein